MKDFFNFNLGIVISLFSIFLTLYLSFKTKFNFYNSFENSPNDRSIKIIFTITNLSSQAKSIDNVILYKGNKVIKDNGYIYSKVEEDIKNENEAKDKEIEEIKRKKQIEKNRLETYNAFYKNRGISYEDALKDIDKHNKQMKSMAKKTMPFFNFDFPKSSLKINDELFNYGMSKPSDDDYMYYSSNFKKHKLLTKDTSVTFSYWVNYKEVPDKVKIVSNNRISLFSHSKTFKIVQK